LKPKPTGNHFPFKFGNYNSLLFEGNQFESLNSYTLSNYKKKNLIYENLFTLISLSKMTELDSDISVDSDFPIQHYKGFKQDMTTDIENELGIIFEIGQIYIIPDIGLYEKLSSSFRDTWDRLFEVELVDKQSYRIIRELTSAELTGIFVNGDATYHMVNGKLHRDQLPAVIDVEDDAYIREWWSNGQLIRKEKLECQYVDEYYWSSQGGHHVYDIVLTNYDESGEAETVIEERVGSYEIENYKDKWVNGDSLEKHRQW
jgi:hypothetical protein